MSGDPIEEELTEGPLGFAWVGCGALALLYLPVWVVVTASLERAWNPNSFPLSAGDLVVLGVSAALLVSAAFAVLGTIIVVGVGVGHLWTRWRARREAARFADVVGDGGVLRPDAWQARPSEVDGPQPPESP